MSGPELFGVRLNSFEGLCWENICRSNYSVPDMADIWPLEPPVSMRHKPLNPVNSLPGHLLTRAVFLRTTEGPRPHSSSQEKVP